MKQYLITGAIFILSLIATISYKASASPDRKPGQYIGLPDQPASQNLADCLFPAITRHLNEVAQIGQKKINYFQIQSIAFETEVERTVGGQKQKLLTLTYVGKVIDAHDKLRVDDTFTGGGSALFIEERNGNWELHRLTVE